MLAEAPPSRPGELHLTSSGVIVGGARVSLTARELEVLEVLVARAGHVVQRGELYREVWGGEMSYRDRSVDVLVKRIRQKLAVVSPQLAYVHTHYGVGYRFDPVPSSPDSPQGGQVE